MDKSSTIFSNPIPKKTVKKAVKSKNKYLRKYGDDSNKEYHLQAVPLSQIPELGILNLISSDKPLEVPEKPFVVGNIRMGFGHYRISLALASCAKALGYTPLWFDVSSFDSTGSKMIREQNDMYSLASKISQKSRLFNSLVWEPLNSEGFKKITYNAVDQANSSLLAPLYHDLPKDTPFVATHVWPSQGAIHAGLTHVVNAIPDNWPMALHLSEGAVHTVQTQFAYYGYKTLDGFAKHPLNGMKDGDLYEVGCYVDHELVSNLEEDTAKRIERLEKGETLRILISVGGAGAGENMYRDLLKALLPRIKEGKVAVYLNFGDHLKMHEALKKALGKDYDPTLHFDDFAETKAFVSSLRGQKAAGLHAFYHKDIFEAVYSTNLLMHESDFIITKPSELSFYPIPKLFNRHIGGHEAYGAVHSAEYGESGYECRDMEELLRALDYYLSGPSLLKTFNANILLNKTRGLYDGGYKAVKLAAEGKED